MGKVLIPSMFEKKFEVYILLSRKELDTQWEKIGILPESNEEKLLNDRKEYVSR